MNQIVQVDGYWSDDPKHEYQVKVSTGSWDGVEDEKDRDIFWYTDGDPLNVGDVISDDFVVTKVWG